MRGGRLRDPAQGSSEFEDQAPPCCHSWDRPAPGHLQHPASLPPPASVAVTPWTCIVSSPWCLPGASCGVTNRELQGTFHLIPSHETSNKINLPFLCACLQWPNPPTHSNTPRWSGPRLSGGRTMKMGRCSARACTIPRQLKNQQLTINSFPYYYRILTSLVLFLITTTGP